MYHTDRYIDYSPFRKPYMAVGTVKNKFRCVGLRYDLFCSPLGILELRDKKIRYVKRGMCHVSFMQSSITCGSWK